MTIRRLRHIRHALGRGASPIAEAVAQALLDWPLTTSITPTTATGDPTFTRATVAYQEDCYGVLNECLSGEARFDGARRVYNELGDNSEDMTLYDSSNATIDSATEVTYNGTNSAFVRSETSVGIDGGEYFIAAFDITLVSGTISSNSAVKLGIIGNGTGSGTNRSIGDQVDGTTKRFMTNVWPSNVGGWRVEPAVYCDDAVTLRIERWQLMRVKAGQPFIIGDYVSTGIESAPYHGANVDGVQYFETLNGNTVDSNGIVTEATGPAINKENCQFYTPVGDTQGYIDEVGADDLADFTDDFCVASCVAAPYGNMTDNNHLQTRNSTGSSDQWRFTLLSDGTIQMALRDLVVGESSYPSTVALDTVAADWQTILLAAKVNLTSSTIDFYYCFNAPSDTPTTDDWIQLGAQITGVTQTAPLKSVAVSLEIGSSSSGASNFWEGKMFRGLGMTGTDLDATPEYLCSVSEATVGTTTWTDTNGHDWEIKEGGWAYCPPLNKDDTEVRGYKGEGASATVNTYTFDLTGTGWADQSQVTTVADVGTTPAGTSDANRLDMAVSTANSRYAYFNYTSTDTDDQTGSAFVKYDGWQYAHVRIKHGTGYFGSAVVDLLTGAITETDFHANVSDTRSGVKLMPFGWVWVEVGYTSAYTGGSATLAVGGAAAATGNTFDTNNGQITDSVAHAAGEDILAWGAQGEEGSRFASSVMNAAGSTATRNADVLTIPFASNLEEAAGTLVCEAFSDFEVIDTTDGVRIVGFANTNQPLGIQLNDVAHAVRLAAASGQASDSPDGIGMWLRPVVVGGTWSSDDNEMTGYYNGVPDATPGTFDGNFNDGVITIAGKSDGSNHLFGSVSRIKGYASVVTTDLLLTDTAFVSTWATTGAAETVTIPLVESGDLNFTIDWGDGQADHITAYNDAALTHTYATADTYTVTMTPNDANTLTGFQFADAGDKTKIKTIENWGFFDISEDDTFYGCSALTVTATDAPTISTATMHRTFRDCTALTDIPSLSTWDVSGVVTMTSVFFGCTSFTASSGVFTVTSTTTNISQMFSQCDLDAEVDFSAWDVSGVTDMGALFNLNSRFVGSSISGWDVSNVTDMATTFASCTVFNGDISGWTVTLSGSAASMFKFCAAFNRDISGWDVSAVTSLNEAFRGCTVFDQDLSTWDIGLVTNLGSTFRDCPLLNFDCSGWDTSSVTIFNNTFYNCTAFDQNLGGWDITSMTAAANMLVGTTLSTANYNALLVGWEAQVEPTSITFHGGNATHSGAGTAARGVLTGTSSWSITDGGAA